MITCSACGGATKVKMINTKFGAKNVGECLSGCKNDKGYPLGTFEKKLPQGVTRPQTASAPAPRSNEVVALLCAINAKLGKIEAHLTKPKFEAEPDIHEGIDEDNEPSPF